MRSLCFLSTWIGAMLLIAGCSGPAKPKPSDLLPVNSLVAVKQVWATNIGEVTFPLEVKVVGKDIYAASSAGVVSAIDADSGVVRWTVSLGARIAAGVGSDGVTAAVVTAEGDLVALKKGKKIWQQRLGGVSITPPLVAGGRVFAITPDRTLLAFDSETGKKLWQQQRGGNSLVLDRPGVLFPFGDTLVTGLGGRLVGLNPLNGVQRWDVPISVSRGSNEVERLVDIVAGISRDGSDLCVRAYLNAVACLNLAGQKVIWSQAANGFSGIAGDDESVFGTESDGRVIAWRRVDGVRVWQSDAMRWRDLGTPLVLGSTLAVPDGAGVLHLLAKSDGTSVGRLSFDASPLNVTPVLVGKTLVVVTQKGGIFAFRPE